MSTRDRLLTAAFDRLRTSGLDAVTTIGVAADIGLSQAGVYRHFANVEELRAETVALVGSEWLGRLGEQRDRLLLRAEERGPAARSAYASELGRLLIDDRSIRTLIDRHRSNDDLLGKRLNDLLDSVIDDIADYLIVEVSHAAPRLVAVAESRRALVRFHSELFVEDILSLARVGDDHRSGGLPVDMASLLEDRLEAGWFRFVADLDTR